MDLLWSDFGIQWIQCHLDQKKSCADTMEEIVLSTNFAQSKTTCIAWHFLWDTDNRAYNTVYGIKWFLITIFINELVLFLAHRRGEKPLKWLVHLSMHIIRWTFASKMSSLKRPQPNGDAPVVVVYFTFSKEQKQIIVQHRKLKYDQNGNNLFQW